MTATNKAVPPSWLAMVLHESYISVSGGVTFDAM